MMEYLLAALVVVIGIAVWALVCNDKTCDQRMDIFPNVNDDMFWSKVRIYERVTYDQHFWALLTFRDPMKLYEVEK